MLVFIILHLFVYPSSNGYNSFMDRDEESIGGLKNPLQPTRQLFYVSIFMDVVAVLLSLLVSTIFAWCIVIYIVCSRLYSYRGVRLKQYPLLGYLTVIINQGSLTFFMVYHGCDDNLGTHVSYLPLLAAAFLIGGFYPITQVYHTIAPMPKIDGVTISMILGVKGTFIFCAFMYSIALSFLSCYYAGHEHYKPLLVFIIFFIPVIIYFVRWFLKVLQDKELADFKHTMQINWLASTCTSLAFITIITPTPFWLILYR